MKRRNFLKACLIGGTTIALGKTSKGWASGSFEGYPEAMGVLVDTTRCIGCRSCEAACNKEQHLPEPDTSFDDASVFQETRRPTAKAYTVVNQYQEDKPKGPVYRKVQCNHCNEPACLSATTATSPPASPRASLMPIRRPRKGRLSTTPRSASAAATA